MTKITKGLLLHTQLTTAGFKHQKLSVWTTVFCRKFFLRLGRAKKALVSDASSWFSLIQV